MFLLSFLTHLALAGVVVYVPTFVNTNNNAGPQDNKVIWGFITGREGVAGIGQHNVNVKKGKVDKTDMSYRLTKEDENPPLLNPLPFKGRDREGMGLFSDKTSAEDHTVTSAGTTLVVGKNVAASNEDLFSNNGDVSCTTSVQCGNRSASTGHGGGDNYDTGSVSEYVRKEIERHKYYPAIARLKGVEGTVYINFYIGREGILGSIVIARSSGSKILDNAGINTIKKIGKVSSIPEELRELDITVPITYRLE